MKYRCLWQFLKASTEADARLCVDKSGQCPPTTHREKSRQRHPAAHVPVSAARRATASPRAARAAGTLPGGRSGGDAKYVPINYLKMWVGCIYFVIHVFTRRQVEYYARVLFSTLGYVKMVCCLMRIDQVLVGFL